MVEEKKSNDTKSDSDFENDKKIYNFDPWERERTLAYFNIKRAKTYNDFSFELLNDTTMLFIHSDTLSFWPDTAVMRRRDYVNNIFSNECHYYMRLDK